MDYYELLGVSRSATTDEINRAYRKLALEHHPDQVATQSPEVQAEATSKITKINKAKAVLTDENSRSIYDQYGEDGLQMQQQQQAPAGMVFQLNPIVAEVYCSVSELYSGCQKNVKYQRDVLDGSINGFRKIKTEDISIDIGIQAKLQYGTEICIKGEGIKHLQGIVVSDLVIKICKPQNSNKDNWSLENEVLHYRLDIQLSEALLGFNRTITHFDNKPFNICCDQMIFKGNKVIKNRGFMGNIPGSDLVIDINVDVNNIKQLTPDQITSLSIAFDYLPPAINPSESTFNLKSLPDLSSIPSRSRPQSNLPPGMQCVNQ